ncbi:MAG: PD40 domain-containing protein, partial [Kiritimatiellae bacterium]|nr:PD40 domain-containing protein [Kiritimatiellia bacterium]
MRVWVCLLAVSVCIKGYADPELVKTAMFRLDASNRASLTLGEAGVVEGWTSLAGEKPVTARPMGTKPVFRTDDRERPFVDFGGMNSRRDLAYPRLTGIRTVFAVGRFDASRFCHLLCDGTAYHFHRGDEGAYGSEEWSKFGRIWNGTLPVEDPFSDPLPDDGVQLVCAEMREGCASDRLTTDRAFPDRNGGRQLYELLVFDRTLSDADRLALTRHLQTKWKVADPTPQQVSGDRDWRLIRRDIANWHRLPKGTNEQAAHPAACIYPDDTDPLTVVLRRARALVDDLAGSVDLAADRDELTRLAAEAATAKGEDARIALFTRVQALVRRVSLKNPLLKGIDRLLFVTHEPPGYNEWRDGSHMCDQYYGFHGTQNGISRGDGLYILERPFSDNPVARNILEGKVIGEGAWKGATLDGCAIISPDLDWDGSRIAFAATRGKNQLDNWNDDTCYHIFTCSIDGTNLRQLTTGCWNEFDPCWLPNGRIVFSSERRGGFVRCSGNRPIPSFTLYSMFDDGSDIVRLSHHETNEWHPSVNNDGMIAYTRWDYVDRGAGQAHHAWT